MEWYVESVIICKVSSCMLCIIKDLDCLLSNYIMLIDNFIILSGYDFVDY